MPAVNRLNYDACGECLSPGIYFKPMAMTNGFTIDLTLGEHHKMQLLLITNKPTFSVSFSLRCSITKRKPYATKSYGCHLLQSLLLTT